MNSQCGSCSDPQPQNTNKQLQETRWEERRWKQEEGMNSSFQILPVILVHSHFADQGVFKLNLAQRLVLES